jgi:hypothetical protein
MTIQQVTSMVDVRESVCVGRERPHTFVLPLTLVAPAPELPLLPDRYFYRARARTNSGPM